MEILKRIGQEFVYWWDAVLIGIPGVIGVKVRNFFYRFRFAECGSKVCFSPGCYIRNFRKIRIGQNVSIGSNAQIYADQSVEGIEIGDHASFNSNVMINADKSLGIKIGASVLVGPNVVFRASDHRFDRRDSPIRTQGDKAGRIVVEEDVWIGANAVILKNVTIRKGAVVAAGAVVVDDVLEYQIVGGVPAKPIGKRG
jgi:galactoside O-acetyltransferase